MEKLNAVTIAADVSPHAYEGTTMPSPVLAHHEFRARDDGQLEHLIDGKLRATVPPEGFADYAHQWPDAAAVIRTLHQADR